MVLQSRKISGLVEQKEHTAFEQQLVVANMSSSGNNDGPKEFQILKYWKGKEISLLDLANILNEFGKDEVRIYNVSSTRMKDNEICHGGSGPNLEGSLATLCTCKHSMRQYHSCNDWKNKWILGVTARAKNKGFNRVHYFFYLMRIEYAFESHLALHKYLKSKSTKTLHAKNATENPLGDLYIPKSSDISDPWAPQNYLYPHKNHSHGYTLEDQWTNDISYNKNITPLLVGDKKYTYVWTKPCIKYFEDRGVGSKKMTIGELIDETIKVKPRIISDQTNLPISNQTKTADLKPTQGCS